MKKLLAVMLCVSACAGQRGQTLVHLQDSATSIDLCLSKTATDSLVVDLLLTNRTDSILVTAKGLKLDFDPDKDLMEISFGGQLLHNISDVEQRDIMSGKGSLHFTKVIPNPIVRKTDVRFNMLYLQAGFEADDEIGTIESIYNRGKISQYLFNLRVRPRDISTITDSVLFSIRHRRYQKL